MKLMVLHNLFFLILSASVYFTLTPLLPPNSPNVHAAMFILLGVIYILAVLALEFLIMPRYVYRPLQCMLDADEASRRGDLAHELITDSHIPEDEIGQIMRSRNETLAQLRRHEIELEQLNRDLQRNNALLETAKKNIADQDRLASLGMLSASVAHELNTPLAVLQGSIEKLMETVEDDASQERLRRMLRVAERLRRMSLSLVGFSRVRREDFESLNLRAIVEESWSLAAIDEKAGRVLFHNLVDPAIAVRGNHDRLIQLMLNLIRNAVFAVAAGGAVSVSSHADPSGQVRILVEDDGPGIPAGVLPNIFEAFVTSRLDARGTGLGLTVAEGIAHQHGGSISASNRPAGGARLEVLLPGG
jgi:signal transduction histidine kinase